MYVVCASSYNVYAVCSFLCVLGSCAVTRGWIEEDGETEEGTVDHRPTPQPSSGSRVASKTADMGIDTSTVKKLDREDAMSKEGSVESEIENNSKKVVQGVAKKQRSELHRDTSGGPYSEEAGHERVKALTSEKSGRKEIDTAGKREVKMAVKGELKGAVKSAEKRSVSAAVDRVSQSEATQGLEVTLEKLMGSLARKRSGAGRPDALEVITLSGRKYVS